MYRSASLALFVLLLSVVGCDSNGPEFPGSFSLLLNGEPRGDSPSAYSDLVYNPSYGYAIFIGWTREDLDLTQGISFILPDLSTRSYPIYPYVLDDFTYRSTFTEADGHQTLQRYHPISESDSLTIIAYDPSTGT